MCIFSGAVSNVSTTKILVSPVYQAEIVTRRERETVRKFKKPVGKPMQLVVYSNKVVLDPNDRDNVTGVRNGAAMILPFPLIKGYNRVAVLDMSRYTNFFDDVELLFPLTRSSNGDMIAYDMELANSQGMISVMDIGSYKASIVPKYHDFARLQFGEFNLDSSVSKLLERYYSRDYGFVVCILKPQATYHPFAYVHELRSNGELFVPTRHYHGDHENTPYNSSLSRSAFSQFHDRIASEGLGMPDDGAEDDRGMIMDDLHLKNNAFDTLMDDDEYMSQQMRRMTVNGGARARAPTSRGSRTGDGGGTGGVDWDHDIYIVNRPRVVYNAIAGKPGVSATAADPRRLEQVANYINFKKMPVDVSFGNIRTIVKLNIDKLYTGNHDLFV